jgi:hypothetical protein
MEEEWREGKMEEMEEYREVELEEGRERGRGVRRREGVIAREGSKEGGREE